MAPKTTSKTAPKREKKTKTSAKSGTIKPELINDKKPQPASPFQIEINGARTNNLKNVSCKIPHKKLTVVTGLSGSGKSSLAFDTLYAEGQRRYVESMSAYARQFLERIEKPDVDQISHILPAIALEQKNRAKNARSTVGTATEIYDYLRLLFAMLGKRSAKPAVKGFQPILMTELEENYSQLPEKTKLMVLAVITPAKRKQMEKDYNDWAVQFEKDGFFRAWVNDELVELADIAKKFKKRDDLLLVIDRFTSKPNDSTRFREAVQQAAKLSNHEGETKLALVNMSEKTAVRADYQLEEPKPIHPNLFSFNHPMGACKTCEGYGRVIGLDLDKVMPNHSLSIEEGVVHPFSTPANAELQDLLESEALEAGIPISLPYQELDEDQKAFIVDGGGEYPGIRKFFRWMERKRYRVHVRVLLARYRGYYECPDCLGSRLAPEALTISLNNETILTIGQKSVTELKTFFEALANTLDAEQLKTAQRPMEEVHSRLNYLISVGLEYLTLNRQSRTLSGGEAQRINLSTALGCGLTDTLYVLDEPTVGLHARDTDRLLQFLHKLRDKGNTLMVVEHDPDMMAGADQIIDMGPAGGEGGGRIVFSGSYNELLTSTFSMTGQCLREGKKASKALETKPFDLKKLKQRDRIEIAGASGHNLKDLTVILPKNQLVCVAGVSGSGKSTLIHKTLYLGFQHQKGKQLEHDESPYKALSGLEEFDDIVMVDQSPPGRSLRSNPVTYLKAYDEIRKLYATSRRAQVLGLKPGDFSFNSNGGRCDKCEGLGIITIDMQFMADVTVTCPECQGRRFKKHILDLEIKDKNINDVLNMTVDDGIEFFKNTLPIRNRLRPLQEIGLGYLRLGQPTSTLSGGEAQRLKLANYVRTGGIKKGEKYLFLFDEPTTGLHISDINVLVDVLRKLLAADHSVVVIEHNLDFIRQVDHVIELGPDGGDNGGEVVFQGSVGELSKSKTWTGSYLKNS